MWCTTHSKQRPLRSSAENSYTPGPPSTGARMMPPPARVSRPPSRRQPPASAQSVSCMAGREACWHLRGCNSRRTLFDSLARKRMVAPYSSKPLATAVTVYIPASSCSDESTMARSLLSPSRRRLSPGWASAGLTSICTVPRPLSSSPSTSTIAFASNCRVDSRVR